MSIRRNTSQNYRVKLESAHETAFQFNANKISITVYRFFFFLCNTTINIQLTSLPYSNRQGYLGSWGNRQ
jgi:hypothetical protein